MSQSVFSPEAQAFGTMLVAYGYVYPLQNHRKLVMCNDATLYRFQVKLNSLIVLRNFVGQDRQWLATQ